MIECIEELEPKLESRLFRPQWRLLGHDQIPVVYAIMKSIKVGRGCSAPEIAREHESLRCKPEGSEGIRVECAAVVFARIELGESRAQIGKAQDAAAVAYRV